MTQNVHQSMTPTERYQLDITAGGFRPDAAQAQVIANLQIIYDEVIKFAKRPWWVKRFYKPQIPGLYLWGSVGSGKTWLMDIFYDCLPPGIKLRLHFHQFMRSVHVELERLQGKPNPLNDVALWFAKQAKVICFDEFFVSDITDAMLLGNLLKALFKQGIILVTTSNVAPDDLYLNGLQRELFLPAIELIKQNTTVMQLSERTDYRLRQLAQASVYFCPLDMHAEQQMRNMFGLFAHGTPTTGQVLEIGGRSIPTVRMAQRVVWFDFDVICNIPRSQLDYLDIAHLFHVVLISNVPKLSPGDITKAQYLINLIDVFYDAKVKLVMSAAVPLQEICAAGDLSFEFKRTLSRIIEMQSEEYLAQPRKIF